MPNPATRLHAILTKARSRPLRDRPMMEGWKTILGLPKESDDLLLITKLGKVYALPEQITSGIQRFKDLDQDLFLGWRKDLTTAFTKLRFDAHFAHFSDGLTDSLLINVKFCAHELERRRPEKEISPDLIAGVRNDIWALYQKISESDIGPPLDRYLLDRLWSLLEAIDDYEISGVAPIESAMNEIVGTIATSPDLAKSAHSSVFGEEFWKILGRIGLILGISTTVLELADRVQNCITQ